MTYPTRGICIGPTLKPGQLTMTPSFGEEGEFSYYGCIMVVLRLYHGWLWLYNLSCSSHDILGRV